jgi:hypothetical protein
MRVVTWHAADVWANDQQIRRVFSQSIYGSANLAGRLDKIPLRGQAVANDDPHIRIGNREHNQRVLPGSIHFEECYHVEKGVSLPCPLLPSTISIHFFS